MEEVLIPVGEVVVEELLVLEGEVAAGKLLVLEGAVPQLPLKREEVGKVWLPLGVEWQWFLVAEEVDDKARVQRVFHAKLGKRVCDVQLELKSK